ncbi:hypothetical protein CDAR_312271 [Caerostris darwini]|uniref:Uncharacterized protein n=1 Tax=Caerostris darwini TaxID=1538125 RepID=A0AAV4QSG7_9ARAC|nr:hypothetical protein CDAR_312271 [Caerostris darwini]
MKKAQVMWKSRKKQYQKTEMASNDGFEPEFPTNSRLAFGLHRPPGIARDRSNHHGSSEDKEEVRDVYPERRAHAHRVLEGAERRRKRNTEMVLLPYGSHSEVLCILLAADAFVSATSTPDAFPFRCTASNLRARRFPTPRLPYLAIYRLAIIHV